jgi:hypothetical protein
MALDRLWVLGSTTMSQIQILDDFRNAEQKIKEFQMDERNNRKL